MTFKLSYFQETDFKEWKVVIQEIAKFLKADTAFMNIRPLRYSVALDLHSDCLPHVVEAKRKLRLRDAILCSYHPNEVSAMNKSSLLEISAITCHAILPV